MVQALRTKVLPDGITAAHVSDGKYESCKHKLWHEVMNDMVTAEDSQELPTYTAFNNAVNQYVAN